MIGVRDRLGLALLIVVPLGLATKMYAGPAEEWVRGSGGGVLYVVFWVLLLLPLKPRMARGWVVPGAVIGACSVEVLQLWRPNSLEWVRGTLPGQLVLGSTFAWVDFPPYFIGGALAYLLSGLLLRGRAATDPP